MGRKRVLHYPDSLGKNPALDFLLSVDRAGQWKAFAYISYLEERGEVLRRSIAEYLGEKLYEFRPKQLRILYAIVGEERAVVRHAFCKKTGSVPTDEKRPAQSRLEDFLRRYEWGLMTVKEWSR